MEDSILNSVKKMLGIEANYTHFDPDITMHINTILVVLHQMGVGKQQWMLTDAFDTWSDFIPDDTNNIISLVANYIYMRVKMLFDPPQGGLKEAMDNAIKELEYRILISVDPCGIGDVIKWNT